MEEENPAAKNKHSRKKSHKKDKNVDVDDSFVSSDKSAESDHNITINDDDDDHESWLSSMIHYTWSNPTSTTTQLKKAKKRGTPVVSI